MALSGGTNPWDVMTQNRRTYRPPAQQRPDFNQVYKAPAQPRPDFNQVYQPPTQPRPDFNQVYNPPTQQRPDYNQVYQPPRTSSPSFQDMFKMLESGQIPQSAPQLPGVSPAGHPVTAAPGPSFQDMFKMLEGGQIAQNTSPAGHPVRDASNFQDMFRMLENGQLTRPETRPREAVNFQDMFKMLETGQIQRPTSSPVERAYSPTSSNFQDRFRWLEEQGRANQGISAPGGGFDVGGDPLDTALASLQGGGGFQDRFKAMETFSQALSSGDFQSRFRAMELLDGAGIDPTTFRPYNQPVQNEQETVDDLYNRLSTGSFQDRFKAMEDAHAAGKVEELEARTAQRDEIINRLSSGDFQDRFKAMEDADAAGFNPEDLMNHTQTLMGDLPMDTADKYRERLSTGNFQDRFKAMEDLDRERSAEEIKAKLGLTGTKSITDDIDDWKKRLSTGSFQDRFKALEDAEAAGLGLSDLLGEDEERNFLSPGGDRKSLLPFTIKDEQGQVDLDKALDNNLRELEINAEEEKSAEAARINRIFDERQEQLTRQFTLTPGGTESGDFERKLEQMESGRAQALIESEATVDQRVRQEARANVGAIQGVQAQRQQFQLAEEQQALERAKLDTEQGQLAFQNRLTEADQIGFLTDNQGNRIQTLQARVSDASQRLQERGMELESAQLAETSRQFDDELRTRVEEFAASLGLNAQETEAQVAQIYSGIEQNQQDIDLRLQQLEISSNLDFDRLGLDRESMVAQIEQQMMDRQVQMSQFADQFGMQVQEFETAVATDERNFIQSTQEAAQAYGLDVERFGLAVEQTQHEMTLRDRSQDELEQENSRRFGLDQRQFIEGVYQTTLERQRLINDTANQFGLDSRQLQLAIQETNANIQLRDRSQDLAEDEAANRYGLDVDRFREASRQFDNQLSQSNFQFAEQLGMDVERFNQAERQFTAEMSLKDQSQAHIEREANRQYSLNNRQFNLAKGDLDRKYELLQEGQAQQLNIDQEQWNETKTALQFQEKQKEMYWNGIMNSEAQYSTIAGGGETSMADILPSVRHGSSDDITIQDLWRNSLTTQALEGGLSEAAIGAFNEWPPSQALVDEVGETVIMRFKNHLLNRGVNFTDEQISQTLKGESFTYKSLPTDWLTGFKDTERQEIVALINGGNFQVQQGGQGGFWGAMGKLAGTAVGMAPMAFGGPPVPVR